MRKYLPFILILSLLFISCAGVPRQQISPEEEALLYPVESYIPEAFDWQEVCPGVSRYDFYSARHAGAGGFPLIYHAVRIDLTLAGKDRPLHLTCARGMNTAIFAENENLTVAVNATPYDKTGALVGVHKEDGTMLSAPVARYAAIAFAEGCARIFASQSLEELDEFPYAFGGFFTVLEGGEVRKDFVRRRDSRSGAGVSADGRTLFILVVEGEHPQQSTGLSYPQCGEIFRAMGCSDALEFDGGGSADLCINKKSVLSYKVRRIVGNCFGF